MRGKVHFEGLFAVFLQDHPRICGEKEKIMEGKSE